MSMAHLQYEGTSILIQERLRNMGLLEHGSRRAKGFLSPQNWNPSRFFWTSQSSYNVRTQRGPRRRYRSRLFAGVGNEARLGEI